MCEAFWSTGRVFCFGPRQTGKSTLIRQQFAGLPTYSLLDQALFVRLSRNPAFIREALADDTTVVVIDEIQKMPELLNEVQLMIERHGVRFLLTGSSARSLRRKGVNLLGGRAWSRSLHPFVRIELKERFDLNRALEYGLLPPVFFSDSPGEDLAAYAGDYLKEEIAAEAAVRNIGAFSRFLETAAHAHGELINFSAMANDAQVPVSTVREYYRILHDTFIAHEVPAWTESRKRKAISTSKYYLFDIGLARHLQGRRGLAPGTAEYGNAFESFIFQGDQGVLRLSPPRFPPVLAIEVPIRGGLRLRGPRRRGQGEEEREREGSQGAPGAARGRPVQPLPAGLDGAGAANRGRGPDPALGRLPGSALEWGVARYGLRAGLKVGTSKEQFVSTFGNGVNLDVGDHQVPDLELMRRGLRKRGIFGLVGSSVDGPGSARDHPEPRRGGFDTRFPAVILGSTSGPGYGPGRSLADHW